MDNLSLKWVALNIKSISILHLEYIALNSGENHNQIYTALAKTSI